MNAATIIEEIKSLPEDERGKVIDFVRHIPNHETLDAMNEPTEGLPRYKNMNDVRAALKQLVHDA